MPCLKAASYMQAAFLLLPACWNSSCVESSQWISDMRSCRPSLNFNACCRMPGSFTYLPQVLCPMCCVLGLCTVPRHCQLNCSQHAWVVCLMYSQLLRTAAAPEAGATGAGATDPENLLYMTRLGLWGRGTAFTNRMTFCSLLNKRGVGAMELVAMDLKMQGEAWLERRSMQQPSSLLVRLLRLGMASAVVAATSLFLRLQGSSWLAPCPTRASSLSRSAHVSAAACFASLLQARQPLA